MKPDDLKSPFTWDERRVMVQDRIWYVPNQYENFNSFTFPGWNSPLFFDNSNPVCIEYCSGNGAWVAVKARMNPQYNWVAVELKFERVRKIWSKLKNFQLTNLMAVCGEGYRLTRHYIPDASIHSVFINFPDPWPKKRHAKHRIVQPSFVNEIIRILHPGGVLTMVTDDADYSRVMIDVVLQFSEFESEFADPYYVTDYPEYGTSYFEDLWRQKGKNIHYHSFRKSYNLSR